MALAPFHSPFLLTAPSSCRSRGSKPPSRSGLSLLSPGVATQALCSSPLWQDTDPLSPTTGLCGQLLHSPWSHSREGIWLQIPPLQFSGINGPLALPRRATYHHVAGVKLRSGPLSVFSVSSMSHLLPQPWCTPGIHVFAEPQQAECGQRGKKEKTQPTTWGPVSPVGPTSLPSSCCPAP